MKDQNPKKEFNVGIEDDVFGTSLKINHDVIPPPDKLKQYVVWVSIFKHIYFLII